MTQLTHNIYAVEVPEDVSHIRVATSQNNLGDCLFYVNGKGMLQFKKLPPGTYQFLFTTKNVTKEQAREVVKPQWMVQAGTTPSYPDYTGEWAGFVDQPSKSFESLLRSKNLDPKKNYAVIKRNEDATK